MYLSIPALQNPATQEGQPGGRRPHLVLLIFVDFKNAEYRAMACRHRAFYMLVNLKTSGTLSWIPMQSPQYKMLYVIYSLSSDH